MPSRREVIKGAAIGAVATVLPHFAPAEVQAKASTKPNIILYISDQFRWDFLGANGGNSSVKTPNLDKLARGGVNFTHTVTNQPLCAPCRSVLMTSRYATETGVWENGYGLDESLPNLAGELRKAGWSANYIGKWHLAPGDEKDGGGDGAVKREFRGGFLDLWEGANALELISHPYHGTIWDTDNNPITYENEYRVDFLTDRAERFLSQKHDRPFFLCISQLEPHQQNDRHQPVAPHGVAEKYFNVSAPDDLKALPGIWQAQLPDYYGCIEAIDKSVGRVIKILEEEGQLENTLFIFLSDHGCHFATRNTEYKRSPHNSSIWVPFFMNGPGFTGPKEVNELVGLIDVAPTILEAVGVPIPQTWKGRSAVKLIDEPAARAAWPNEQYIQISESMTGRAVRTPDWTYCVADMTGARKKDSQTYTEYQIYDQRSDPNELVNLAGRREYRETANQLKARLKRLMSYAGEAEAEIKNAPLYP